MHAMWGNLVWRFGLFCTLFLSGCSHAGPAPIEKNGETHKEKEKPLHAQKLWSASLYISHNLLDEKEREHEIVLGDNFLETIGITDDGWPIVTATFGKIFAVFSLEVYLNPKATLRGPLFRSLMPQDVWTQTSFTNWKGQKREETWRIVSGEVPQKEEWFWNGTYRTDGKTLFCDVMNKNGSTCSWMLTAPAPRKSRQK